MAYMGQAMTKTPDPTMTAEDLSATCDALGLSTQTAFARLLNEEMGTRHKRQSVHRWFSGARPVPPYVAAWLRGKLQLQDAINQPVARRAGPRQRGRAGAPRSSAPQGRPV